MLCTKKENLNCKAFNWRVKIEKYVKGDSKSFTNSSNLLIVHKDAFNDYRLSRSGKNRNFKHLN